MKSAEEIATEMLDAHFRGVRNEIQDVGLKAWMTRAIEADRAQRPSDAGIREAYDAWSGIFEDENASDEQERGSALALGDEVRAYFHQINAEEW